MNLTEFPKETVNKLNKVSYILPQEDILDFFNSLLEAYKENQITERELARIEAQKEIVLLHIKEKYNLYHKIFDKIFEERQQAINKSFEVIDKGIRDDNRDLISSGLHALSKVVSSSPFVNLQQLRQALEGNEIIEI